MTIGPLFAAPTVVRLAGESWLVRPLRLIDYATLVRGAADHAGRNADAGDEPGFGDETTIEWMTGEGLPLFLYLALHRDRPGFTFAHAEALAVRCMPTESASVYLAALRRSKLTGASRGQGVDIAKVDWSGVAWRFAKELQALPDALGDLTLDQAHVILSRGDDGNSLSMADVMAQYQASLADCPPAEPAHSIEEALARLNGVGWTPVVKTLDQELAEMGLSIVKESEVTPEVSDD